MGVGDEREGRREVVSGGSKKWFRGSKENSSGPKNGSVGSKEFKDD